MTINIDQPFKQDIATRFDSSLIEEKSVCSAHESFIYPKTAKNIDKEWRFVVNVEDDQDPNNNFLQAVRIERCSREGQSCEIETVRGTETVCRQKYSEKKLVAISPDGEKYVDTFRLPSCCICHQKTKFRLELSSQDSTRTSFLTPLRNKPKKVVEPLEDVSVEGQGLVQGQDEGQDDGQQGQAIGFEKPKTVEEFDDPLDHDYVNFGLKNADTIVEEKIVRVEAYRRHRRNV